MRILISILFCTALSLSAWGQAKIPVTSASELPQLTYELPDQSAWETMQDHSALEGLAQQVEADLKDVLERYDIQDRSTLRGWYDQLLTVALFENDLETAVEYVAIMRELGGKPTEQLMSGNLTLSRAEAMRETGESEGEAYRAALAEALKRRLDSVPFEVARQPIQAFLGSADLLSPELVQKSIEGQFQPLLDKMGRTVPANIVIALLDTRLTLDLRLPLTPLLKEVYQAYFDAHQDDSAPVDIWAERNFELPASDELAPVVIAVWDAGVDMAVFPESQRFVHRADPVDGQDNDGNGYIDDYHGIAYDAARQKNTHLLLPRRDSMQYDLATLQSYLKGSMDLQAGLNTTEDAQQLIKTYQSLEAQAMQAFGVEVGWYGSYAHGTHVAGIAVAGNPQAQVLAARIEWSSDPIPPAPTEEISQRTAQMYREAIAYFRAQGARVVNMSWRYGASGYEQILMLNGIGESPEERREMARELFEVEKKALFEAIHDADDILFVAGSGNENNDANFAGYIPASFELPNLLTVGAVDSEGKRTAFTSEGASIDCYANGFEIESYVPGGDRLAMSGTSMASPQVANLAAKLLSVNPELSVAQLRQYIEQGCDVSEEGIRLLNPKRSLQLLMQAR